MQPPFESIVRLWVGLQLVQAVKLVQAKQVDRQVEHVESTPLSKKPVLHGQLTRSLVSLVVLSQVRHADEPVQVRH